MTSLALEIRESRTAVKRLLGGLGLRAFVFTIEAVGGGWRLSIECATEQGWQTITLPVDLGELRATLRDPATRKRVRDAWSKRLEACTKRGARAR